MNRKRFVILAVVLGLVSAVGIGAWTLFFSAVKVQVSQVEGDVPVLVFGLGTVEARVTSKVGFKVSGVLVELRADIGDRVAKGSVLGRLDDREQRAQVARAKAAIAQTEANLQRARASVEKAQANNAMPRASADASKDSFKPTPPPSRRQKQQRRRKTLRSRI